MTASPTLDLIETRDGTLRPLLPQAGDPASWHAAMTAEIGQHLTPAHAALLATPVRSAAGWTWRAAGEAQRGFTDLAASDRRALTTAIGVILSDIRRLGESGRAPAVAACWPALREVPDWRHVFAVDGRPVLAAWGHGGADGSAGLLARLDDDVPWRAPPRLAWPVYAATLGAVALLALAAGLLLPVLGGALLAGPPACVAAPGELDLLGAQNAAAARGSELKQLLAALDDDIGRRQLQCPIRTVPAPPPPPHADLPQDRWNQHDLSMLLGCWRNTTDLALEDAVTGEPWPIREWRMCFDRSGAGRQTIFWKDGRSCTGRTHAAFDNNGHVTLTDLERCAGSNRDVYTGVFVCERISDTEAKCERTPTEGPDPENHRETGLFVR
jgi:hypothetical protein